ncbi:ribonuclease H-like domain-containing protein, partial [Tanacetum coccineum]
MFMPRCTFPQMEQSGNEKWAPATSHRKNNKPYVDASRTKQTIETITQKHAVKQNTRKTDNTMLPSTRRVSSTNASGSKPKSNTKNDRIPQPSSRSKKNKVEAHHRKFKSSANKNNHVSRIVMRMLRMFAWFRKIWISREPRGYRKPELKYLYVFGALCYHTNDFEDLGKLQPKANIGIFICYSPSKKMDSEQHGSGPDLHGLTSRHISSGLVLNQAASTSAEHPTKNDWDLLFQPMFDEYFKSLSVVSTPISVANLLPSDTAEASSSTTSIDQEAPSPSNSPNIEATNSPINSTNVEPNEEVVEFDKELKNYKEAMEESCWIEAMQEEIHEFEWLKVWELVPRPNRVMIISLKWIFKVKLDDYSGVLKNNDSIFLAYVAHKNMVVFQMDVKTAFPNGILKEEVYAMISYWYKSVVGVKSLLDAVWITDAHVYVNAAQLELVLLTKVNAASENKLEVNTTSEYQVNAASENMLEMIDYALWEVIENGTTLPKTKIVEGVMTEMPIITTEEKAQRRLEVKARSTLMMGIPNEHQLKLTLYKLKLKKLLELFEKLLELLDEKLLQEDVNQKLLRSLAPKWNTHAVVWRNKADLDTMSMDDLYNNLKVYEPEVKGMSSSSSSTQNMAFWQEVFENTRRKLTVNGNETNSFCDNSKLECDGREPGERHRVKGGCGDGGGQAGEVDGEVLAVGGRGFRGSGPGERSVNGKQLACWGSSSVEEGVEHYVKGGCSVSGCRALREGRIRIACGARSGDRGRRGECQIVDNYKKGLGYENYNAVPPPYIGNFMPPTPDLSFIGLDEFVNKPVVKNCKAMSSEEEPKIVRKNDDALCIEEWVSDDEEEDASQPKIEKKTVRPSIVKKDFVKSKQQEKTTRKTVKQVEQHRQNTHSPRDNQRNWNNMMSQKLRSNFEMFNKACYMCGSFDHLQVDCNYHQKQFQNQRMVKPVWNNSQRVNHQNFAKKTNPCAKRNLVPRAVLMKSGLISINTAGQNISKTIILVNTARQVNAAHSKITVNVARPISYLSKIAHSTIKRPIHKNKAFKNSNINQRDNTVRGKNFNTARPKAVVYAVKGNNFNAVKASAFWVWKPKHKVLDHVSKHNSASITLKKFDRIDAQGRSNNPQIDLHYQGVIDSRCSRHMTGNMSYLTNYEEIDGGYVAFRGNPKGGKITRKGTQSNGFVGTKSSDNASQARKETEPKVDEDPRKESECNDQEKEDNVNSTNNVNAASTNKVNVVDGKASIELPFNLNIPALEDYSIFDFSRDDEDDGAVVDMNNLDTTIQVSPILTTRIHKDHPLNQVIRDLQSATQTRKMLKNLEEHGFLSTIQQRTSHKDLQNYLFAFFLSQEEPKK